MINLLPPQEKQKIFFIKNKKIAIIWGIIILVSLISLILVLLSIKFYVLAMTDEQKDILNQVQQKSMSQEFVDLTNVVKKYNGTLAQLDSFYKNELYFSKAIEVITNVPTPEGLRLINFSVTRTGEGTVDVAVSGVSDTRDNLLSFKKDAESTQNIKNLYFSPDSWISPENVKFSLKFVYER